MQYLITKIIPHDLGYNMFLMVLVPMMNENIFSISKTVGEINNERV